MAGVPRESVVWSLRMGTPCRSTVGAYRSGAELVAAGPPRPLARGARLTVDDGEIDGLFQKRGPERATDRKSLGSDRRCHQLCADGAGAVVAEVRLCMAAHAVWHAWRHGIALKRGGGGERTRRDEMRCEAMARHDVRHGMARHVMACHGMAWHDEHHLDRAGLAGRMECAVDRTRLATTGRTPPTSMAQWHPMAPP